ncbi:MAG: tyrosine-type recombinase/integrase, partial [Propionibacteriaceae bacterium]|nr:tyrosine-type recombinase/integrase [Propionibacteriaceae bacterium]
MANKAGHRRFGTVRQRPSGRWQARYPGPDGRLHSAPETFERKRDAERYLILVESAMARNEWIDPAGMKIRLGDYAARWVEQRAGLRPRTVQLYRWTLKKHITPYLGDVPLGRLDTSLIREWRARLLAEGVSRGMAAKAYRLLRAVLWTAVKEDELLARNPCRIPAADKETPAERPHLTMEQLADLTDAVPDRYRLMILLAAFASLRFGEITALQRRDLDLEGATVRVRHQFLEVRGQGLVLGPPKSRAGTRLVAIPAALLPLLRSHVEQFVNPTGSALIFTTSTGSPIRRSSFNKFVNWRTAVESIGVPSLHFHDLR